MRVATLAALGLAAFARADIADNVEDAASSVSSAAAEASSSAASLAADVIRPTFTPTTLKAPFLDQFTDDLNDSRWQVSSAKKADTEEEWQYVGTWAVEEPTVLVGMEGDKGLVVKNKAAHHAISAKFDKPIDNKDKTLVVQYEVKLQGGLECGGAYMKLLQENKELHANEFSNAAPYIIMFGPDKCGSTNKVHFIFRHKNPKTGEYEEKHLKTPPSAHISTKSVLYTLIVKPDQTYEIKIDGESLKSGSLLEDFFPTVNPPKEIDDPNDNKPEDWVDDARIPDPEAKKPEDWDEDQPFEIVDEEATKPDDWLESEPTMVPDPEAAKPEDWDDEEDGDWIAPLVSNSKCDAVSGCGPWEKPMIKNPEYKGKWTAPMVENPAYKGVWAPAQIANPDYYEDKTPANFEPMGAIGFELWTMQNDILFDNIYIGHSIEDAEAFQKETWAVKHATEEAIEDAEIAKGPQDAPPKSPMDLAFMDDPITYIVERTKLFVEIAKRNPVEAAKFLPDVAGGLAVGVITLILILTGAVAGGAAAAPSKEQVNAKAKQAKDAARKTKDQVADAVASGTDRAREELKRSTRSTS